MQETRDRKCDPLRYLMVSVFNTSLQKLYLSAKWFTEENYDDDGYSRSRALTALGLV